MRGTGRADGAAEKLVTPRQVSFSGAASGSFTYDGSANSSCILTLANSGVVAGTYSSTIQIPSITVNDKGLITGISQQTIRSASVTQAGVVQLVDDLVTDDNAKALTAKQGRALQLLKLDKMQMQSAYKWVMIEHYYRLSFHLFPFKLSLELITLTVLPHFVIL